MLHRLVEHLDPALGNSSSMLSGDSGSRTYIVTTKRITSGDELNLLSRLAGLQGHGMEILARDRSNHQSEHLLKRGSHPQRQNPPQRNVRDWERRERQIN